MNPFIQFLKSLEPCQIIASNMQILLQKCLWSLQLTRMQIFVDIMMQYERMLLQFFVFERNMVIFSKTSNVVRSISVLSPSLDVLAYPLLFPHGDPGCHTNIRHNIPSTSTANNPRISTTMLQYVSYRLAYQPQSFSILHHSQKLLLQWIVDTYVRVEGCHLHYIFVVIKAIYVQNFTII